MASDFEPERSPEARALAEEALLRLLVALEGEDVELVVLGGLVPEILTRGQAEAVPTHLGTTDVDIHISFGVDADRDLSPLEQAFEAIGAEPDAKIDGWRWRIRVGGVRVKIEFLCDRDDFAAGQGGRGSKERIKAFDRHEDAVRFDVDIRCRKQLESSHFSSQH